MRLGILVQALPTQLRCPQPHTLPRAVFVSTLCGLFSGMHAHVAQMDQKIVELLVCVIGGLYCRKGVP